MQDPYADRTPLALHLYERHGWAWRDIIDTTAHRMLIGHRAEHDGPQFLAHEGRDNCSVR